MRILLANDLGEGGGTERYLARLSRALAARGHEVLLAAGTPAPGIPCHVDPVLRQDAPEDLAPLLRTLQAFKPDAVYLNNLKKAGVMRALAALAPAVCFIHVPSIFCPGGAKFWRTSGIACPVPYSPRCLAYAWTQRCAPRRPGPWIRTYRRTGGYLDLLKGLGPLVVASRFMADQAALAGLPRERIAVLPYFIDAPEAEPPPPGEASLLFAGRLVHDKGVHVLLDALRRMPSPPPLRVAGEGPERARLEKLAEGLDARFLGWLPEAALREEISRASVLAVPSLWPEPFGIVGLEAMAQGRPVVGSAVGGIPDWLEGGRNGLLASPGDPEALAKVLQAVLDDRDAARRMGLAGWRKARSEFTEAGHVDALLPLFHAA